MVVYADGSVRYSLDGKGQGGAGVVIQGQETIFISQPIGIRVSILVAETAAVLIGLLTALNMPKKKKRIVIKTDCKALADQIANPTWGRKNKDLAYKDLLGRLRELMTPDIKVEWVPRGQNKVADGLARAASLSGV